MLSSSSCLQTEIENGPRQKLSCAYIHNYMIRIRHPYWCTLRSAQRLLYICVLNNHYYINAWMLNPVHGLSIVGKSPLRDLHLGSVASDRILLNTPVSWRWPWDMVESYRAQMQASLRRDFSKYMYYHYYMYLILLFLCLPKANVCNVHRDKQETIPP